MRLLDAVMHARGPVEIDLPGHGRYMLPGAAARAAAVAAAPLRYVLADDVSGVCRRIIDRWPAMLDPADPRLRVPAERMWLEWINPPTLMVVAPRSQACGLLAEVDPSGRRGTIESFWMDPDHGAERAQFHVEFDLDRSLVHRIDNRRVFGMPARTGSGLASLARHVAMCIDPGWLDYFDAAAPAGRSRAEVVQGCLHGVWRDLPMLLAFGRLLDTRPELDERSVERGRLNLSRAKRGKTPLLDHVELGLRIGHVPLAAAAASGHRRSDPRLHLVRGHIVNRRGRLYWRCSHLRGRPDLAAASSRTVNVSMAI